MSEARSKAARYTAGTTCLRCSLGKDQGEGYAAPEPRWISSRQSSFSPLAFSNYTQLHGIRPDHARWDEDTEPPAGLNTLENTCTPRYAIIAVVEYLAL